MTRRPPSRSPSGRRRQPENKERPAPTLRRSTIVVTNLSKLIALGIAVNETVVRHNARESVVAFCALCLIGAQAFEEIVVHAIDRVFGRDE